MTFPDSLQFRSPRDELFASRLVRTRATRKAVLAAILARTSGMALQLVSLPIAAAALGAEGFAVYAMLVAILSWLALSNIGLGPALTVDLARLRGQGNSQEFNRTFSTGFWLIVGASLLVALSAVVAVIATPLPGRLFGSYPTYRGDIFAALGLVIAFFFTAANLGSVEAAQTAHQQQHRMNLFVSVGTLTAALAVLAAARLDPLPSTILIACFAPPLAARILNAVLFLTNHRNVAPAFSAADTRKIPSLLRNAIQFSTAGSLNNFLCHVFPLLLIGATGIATQTASFAAVIGAVTIAASFFGVFSSSLLGGVSDAYARGDLDWLRQSYVRMLETNIAYAAAILAVLTFAGEMIFRAWYQGVIDPNRTMLVAAGVYLMALAIESANVTFLNGLGQVSSSARWSLTKAIVSAALIAATVGTNATGLPFILLATASLLLSAIPLTFAVFRQLWAAHHGD